MSGFLKVFNMIFRVLGGMKRFLGFLISVLLLINVSGNGCWIGVESFFLIEVLLLLLFFLISFDIVL